MKEGEKEEPQSMRAAIAAVFNSRPVKPKRMKRTELGEYLSCLMYVMCI